MPFYTNTKIDAVDYIAAADLEAIETGFEAVDTAKANKIVPSVTGNVAKLSSTGDLVDTGLATPASAFVGLTDTQTLTNKVLTAPQINDTTGDHQYVFNVSELAADRTVTLPLLLGNDTFVFADFIQTLTNKTLTSPVLTTPQINDTTADHQYVFAVSELAADRNITLPLLGSDDTFVFAAFAQTLTNKRVTPRISSTTSITSPLAWNSDNFSIYEATAQAENLTINADSGTPTNGQMMEFILEDNATPRNLTFATGTSKSFAASGVVIPSATTSGKTLRMIAQYRTASDRWEFIAVIEEA